MIRFLPVSKVIIPEAVEDRLKQITHDKIKGKGLF